LPRRTRAQHSRYRHGPGHRQTDRPCAWRRVVAVEFRRRWNGVHRFAAERRCEAMSAGRILVVDDDPQIRRVMRVTLTGQSYEVDDAKDGETALEKLRGGRFDLVLLDMNMPGIGGFETCRLIRGQSDVAIIMLTVRDTETDKVEALDAGADDYVTKPYNPP